MPKNIAIMQPYFFPYLGYFQLINYSDEFILYGNVTFRKKSFITRNHIMDVNGRQEDIKVFVKKASSNSSIKSIHIAEGDWKKKLSKKVQTLYSRSSYFDEIYPTIKECIESNCDSLHKYNADSIQKICNLLAINTTVTTEHQHLDYIEDLLEPSQSLPVSSQRVIHICREIGATTYINPEGGVDLYDKTMFAKEGLTLKFFKASLDKVVEKREYNRYVSIIDILMHNGIEGTKAMLNDGSIF